MNENLSSSSSLRLSKPQREVIDHLNDFINNTDVLNLFIQITGKFFGLHYAMLVFVYECKAYENIIYYHLTQRQAKESYTDFLKILQDRTVVVVGKHCSNTTDGVYNIEFLQDGTNVQRKVKFIVMRDALPLPSPTLSIFDQFIYELIRNEEVWKSYVTQTKSIWILSNGTINNDWLEDTRDIMKSLLMINK